MTVYKHGPVSVTTNLDVAIQRIQGLNYPSGIFGKVWTDVEYALFVEFGTAKMAPLAMVRDSLPAIKGYLEQELKQLRALPTPLELKALVDKVLVFAREEIARNTPVRSGRLRASWKIEEAKLR